MASQRLNDMRVWAAYDTVIGRIECLSERQADCRKVIEIFEKNHRHGVRLLRFDLCPLYYDQGK